jgi:hypothetical protein
MWGRTKAVGRTAKGLRVVILSEAKDLKLDLTWNSDPGGGQGLRSLAFARDDMFGRL